MKTYIFTSHAQLIINTYVQGKPTKIRFNALHGGVSMLTTQDEIIAEKVRQSTPYMNGIVREEVSEEEDAPVADEPAVTEVKKEVKAPAWLNAPMKSNAGSGEKMLLHADKEEGHDEKPAATPVPGDLFGMKPEDLAAIDNLTDAKTYLKDVMGAKTTEINTVAKFKSYCQEKGVKFPNLDLE